MFAKVDETPTEQSLRLLRTLTDLGSHWADAERATELAHTKEQAAARQEAEAAAEAAASRLRDEIARSERECSLALQATETRLQIEEQAIEAARDWAVEQVAGAVALLEQQALQAYTEARWLAHSVYEAQSKRLADQAMRAQRRIQQHQRSLASIERHADECVAYLGLAPAPALAFERQSRDDGASEGTQREQIDASLERATLLLGALRALRLPRLVRGAGWLTILLAAAALVAPVCFLLFGAFSLAMAVSSAALIAVVTLSATLWLRRIARRQVAVAEQTLRGSLAEATALCQQALRGAAEESRRRKRKLRAHRDREFARAEDDRAAVAAACRRRQQTELPQLTHDADQKMLALDQASQRDLAEAQTLGEQRVAGAREQWRATSSNIEAILREQMGAAEVRRANVLAERQSQSRIALAKACAELVALQSELHTTSPVWQSVAEHSPKPGEFPRAVRLGSFAASTLALPGPLDCVDNDLPAALSFPNQLSLLVTSELADRDQAIQLVQTVGLRLLTSLPPGKVRFTIIDPTGLGEAFAGWMHLADYDEALVGHRIWTEPAQIERKLAEITEHMETVIQKYLRNEFASIHDYNRQAGEMAEPLRVVIMANFSQGVTDATMRRLASIAAAGPRCGVHLLISADERLGNAAAKQLAELRQHLETFQISAGEVLWRHDETDPLSVVVDAPPEKMCKPLLQSAGEAAIATRRVEVPFEAIAPRADEYWTADSRRGLNLPLGRAGATRLQHLRLGEGTSQHVLIAGKTGSGKSTLLHALITNAALRYAPSELQMYLIDFKKGVEFKPYVTHRLPHARVVAIESEREFGLSVMQRLDREMRRRGEQFRALGVQDVAAYRDAGHDLPRVLLIVDEFQEYFVQDDKIAQEAALLLDRLVRQGRAFGIHVILGSQTLGGAYGLARSTLGQMAVRIALQCNEADAQLILSDDNAAAKLLTRPGEAIYNDANGFAEGNHLFQVVWTPDDRREHYLDEISALAESRGEGEIAQVVFEGSQPADIAQSAAFASAAREPRDGDARHVCLGEALALDGITQVTFEHRHGANLLWLGQDDRLAGGMMAAALLSLLTAEPEADASSGAPTCVLLHAGKLGHDFDASTLQLANSSPHRFAIHPGGDAADVMSRFAAELERRREGQVTAAPWYLLVHNLAMLRQLRRQDDDFGYGRSGQEATARADRQFAELLREGPALGLHTLIWCDSLANFNRSLERSALKEFDNLVLLQMSAADSSLLIDSAAASQLGPHRALLYRQDQGMLEKFRPFLCPAAAWLKSLLSACEMQSTATVGT
ncbi:MAG: FtsK/SpoIIIE domain-containing protein [Planctomycetia bacterium]|nr:FtsK/SpoIIIE domain-containing protein [Planctomycetia bacterium]